MARRPIEFEKGSILPLQRGPWFAAFEKLEEAAHAITLMHTASNRIAYEAGWSSFVDSLEQFWVRFFDEGKNAFTNFQPWAGAFDSKRKSDPLLQYVYQARHQSQHGRMPLEWEADRMLIAPGFNGRLYGLRIFPDGTYEAASTPAHPSQPEATVVRSPGKPLLPTILNKKHSGTFAPPTTHLGSQLVDVTPTGVAAAALDFYRGVLQKAMSKFYGNSA